jgi:hypothetical protein
VAEVLKLKTGSRIQKGFKVISAGFVHFCHGQLNGLHCRKHQSARDVLIIGPGVFTI